MSLSVTEGLSDGDEGFESSADKFDASFQAKAEAFLAEEAAAEGLAAPPATEAPTAPLRDEQGRFIPATPAAPAPVVEGTPPGADATTPDPWEARYAELQSVFDRQANELGDLRKKVEGIEQAPAAPEVEPISFIPVEQAIMLVENMGPKAAVSALATDGVDPDSQAYKAVFEAALDLCDTDMEKYDLFEKRVTYKQEIENALIEAQYAEQQGQSQGDPAQEWLQESYAERQVEAIVQTVRAATPDFDELADYFEPALKQAPLLAEAIKSGDPQQTQQALGLLVLAARGVRHVTAQATGQAQSQAAVAAQAAQVAAQVVSGGQARPAAPAIPTAAGGFTPEEQTAIAAFKQGILGAGSVSIQDGLTTE